MIALHEEETIISFISATVHALTGLKPQEKETEEKYLLFLGNVDRIELGFDKLANPELDKYRYNAFVTLMHVIADQLREPEQLQYWISLQSNSN